METFYIQWHITDRCNLRCIHCYQEKFTSHPIISRPSGHAAEFTKDGETDWQGLLTVCNNLFQTAARWNKKLNIALTGGEPLLKKELWTLLDYLDTSEYVDALSIITNGTLIDRYLSDLMQFGKLKKVFVSLDGTKKEINDDIRGEGTFYKVVENIKLLVSESDLQTVIMFTVLKRNIENSKLLLEFANELKVDGVIFERFIPLGYGKKISHEVISSEELEELYRNILEQCDVEYLSEEMVKYRALQVTLAPAIMDELNLVRDTVLSGKMCKSSQWLFRGSAFSNVANFKLYGAECIVARDGLAILPDGTVLPCRRFYLPAGNLLSKPLSDIWEESKVLNDIRNRNNLKGKCKNCRISECIGCRAMTFALTGDYLAEDPHCWLDKSQTLNQNITV
ncbi:MAG: radical SAM protein [Elusimicrobiota bacterium]|nr:radical SAM protein [Elusimicrobiota bacterium]